MWILFGTSYNTVENEPYAYFIGVFNDLETATIEKEKLVSEKIYSINDLFIKNAELNKIYTNDWSNNDDI